MNKLHNENDWKHWVFVAFVAMLMISSAIYTVTDIVLHIKPFAIFLGCVIGAGLIIETVSRFSRQAAYITVGVLILLLTGYVLSPVVKQNGALIFSIRLISLLLSPWCLRKWVIYSKNNQKWMALLAGVSTFVFFGVFCLLGRSPDIDYDDYY